MTNIEIEFYEAGKNVLIIFTGVGGTTKGAQNRYELIAEEVIKNYDFSVAVATTPSGSWFRLDGNNLEDVMNTLFEQRQDKDFTTYVMGMSAGANIVLNYSYLFPQIKRVLAINPVLNMNLHKIHQGIKEFTGEKINVIFGENDASSQYAVMLPKAAVLKTTILPNVDHSFTCQLQTFIDLPKKFLFSE